MTKKVAEQRRSIKFCEKVSTAIWKETPNADNPYHVDEARCHGYEHLALANNKSFSEVLFLLFRRELPSPEQLKVFDTLLVSVIHPGPRHAATRAAMNAAVSKTTVSHILPVSLSVMSGEWQGSHEISLAAGFIRKNRWTPAEEVAAQRLEDMGDSVAEGDITVAPGFGTVFGTADPYARKLAENILALNAELPRTAWASELSDALSKADCGWRISGLFAAVMLDLGFNPYQAELIYQIASAPGIAAQASEKASRPLTDMPFLADENYVIE